MIPPLALFRLQRTAHFFSNAQTYDGTPTLNVNSLGAYSVRRTSGEAAGRYEWRQYEIVDFVFDGTYWVIVDGGIASVNYYGVTKLYTGAESTAADVALTPAALNSFAQSMIAGASPYSSSSMYAVGDRVRYNNGVYECKTAITTAEAWTSSKWTKLASLQEQIDDITTELADQRIGGRNCLLNSSFSDPDNGLDKWSNNGSAAIRTLSTGIVCGYMDIAQKSIAGGVQSINQWFGARVSNYPAGQLYTVSGDFVVNDLSEGSNPVLGFIFNGYYDDNGIATLMTPVYVSGSNQLRNLPSNSWVHRSYTIYFPHKLSAANFLVYAREVDCRLYWKDLKVEIGNTETAWTPAPEDYDPGKQSKSVVLCYIFRCY